MTRIMRDSTTASDIPLTGTDIAAGYINGSFAWTTNDWARFKTVVMIDVNGSRLGADVRDIETGDGTPQDGADWVHAKIVGDHLNQGYWPVVYISRDELPQLDAACAGIGLRRGVQFGVWLATLDGTKVVPDMRGVVAVQYAGENITGHHYDQSIVYDDSWKRPVVTPPPPPPPHTLEIRDMLIAAIDPKSVPAGQQWPGDFLLGSDGKLSHISTPEDLAAYKAAGVPGPVTITWEEYLSRK